MIRKCLAALFFCLLVFFTGCASTGVQENSSKKADGLQEGTLVLVSLSPESDKEIYTSAFALGVDPEFDYSKLLQSVAESEYRDRLPYSPLDVLDELNADDEKVHLARGNRIAGEREGSKWQSIQVLDRYDDSYRNVDATCIYSTDHVYYYLDDSYPYQLDERLVNIAALFEEDYLKIRKVLGSESDIDRNGHIRILLTDIGHGIISAFSPVDRYGNSALAISDPEARSNEADVIYLSTEVLEEGASWSEADIQGSLIHEFAHMTLFDYRLRNNLPTDIFNTFFYEGIALWCEAYCDYPQNLVPYIRAYLSQAVSTSVFSDTYECLGLASLFFLYFEEYYGLEAISKLKECRSHDMLLAFEEAGGKSFKELFDGFAKMLFYTIALDDTSPFYMESLSDGAMNLPQLFKHALETSEGRLHLDYGNVVSLIESYSLGLFYSWGDEELCFEYRSEDIGLFHHTAPWFVVDME